MYNMAKALHEIGHQVYIVSICDESPSDKAIQALSELGNYHHIRKSSIKMCLSGIKGIFSSKPLQTSVYRSTELSSWIQDNNGDFDIIYCNHPATAPYAYNFEGGKVIDFVDAMSISYDQMDNIGNFIWKFIYKIESKRLQSYEAEIASDFDLSLITSEPDRNAIVRNVSNPDEVNIRVIPNGVSKDITDLSTDGNRPWVSFLGDMSYHPNIDAALFFASEVFPKIKQVNPNVHFKIVGKDPAMEIKKLQNRESIDVTGFVDNPYEYISKSMVSVAPMRYGGGIQNKVIESMGVGTPVVATSKAIDGLNVTVNDEVIVADEPDSMAEEVNRLLSSQDQRSSISKSAKERILTTYTWESIQGLLGREEIFSELD